MKYAILFLFGALLPLCTWGQQLPYGQNMQTDSWMWNPALAGHFNYLELGAYYRQQWHQFDGAPATAFMGAQLPFIEANMGLGLSGSFDQAGPLKVSRFALAYAYQLKSVFSYHDRLSFGLSASSQWYRFSGRGLAYNDPGDPAIEGVRESFQSLQAGAGFLYSSVAGDDFEESGFFLGASARQLLPAGLRPDEYLRELMHFNLLMGYRFATDQSMVEPSARVHFTQSGQWHANLAVRFEYLSSFWAGSSFATSGAVGLMGGVILGSNQTAGTLHLGLQGDFNLASRVSGLGPSLEFIAIYRYYRLW